MTLSDWQRLVPRQYATGLAYPEGPSFDREGQLFVCVRRSGYIVRITTDGRVEHFMSCAKPNGSKFHPSGDLYVCDSFGGQVLAVTPTSEVRCVVNSFEAKPLLGPNDLVFDATGGLFFTDPGLEIEAAVGGVYRLDVSGRLDRVAEDLQFPNGIALTPGDQALLVAESGTQRILQWDLSPGRLPEGGPMVFAELRDGHPDGIALDAEGRVYAALHGHGKVVVWDASGGWVGELNPGGQMPTNLAFWDGSLYVTEDDTEAVQRLDIGVQGLPLYHQRGA